MLVLDTGDAVGGAGEYAQIKADFYAKALPYMGYDAVGAGEMEARYFKDFHTQQLYGKTIQILSANIIDASTKRRLTKDAYLTKKTKFGLRVGIISLLAPQLVDVSLQEKFGVTIAAPTDILKKEFKRLRDKSDIVILLGHGDVEGMKRLATDFPGLDVIIAGHSFTTQLQEKPEQVGSALFMTTRPGGKYAGKLVLDIGADRKIAGFTGEYAPLDTTLQDDPEMAKLVVRQDKDLEDYYARMRMQYTRYNPVDSTQASGPRPFVSASKCALCHAAEYTSWQKTGHATTFDKLRKDKKTSDPECVSCHTTGYRSKGGFISEYATPHLEGVQCEVCHGPGVSHSRKAAKGYGAVIPSTCAQCHDRVNSPKFSYDTYRALVLHKKGPGEGSTVTAISK